MANLKSDLQLIENTLGVELTPAQIFKIRTDPSLIAAMMRVSLSYEKDIYVEKRLEFLDEIKTIFDKLENLYKQKAELESD